MKKLIKMIMEEVIVLMMTATGLEPTTTYFVKEHSTI